MVAFKTLSAAVATLALGAVSVQANHWLTVVNGCTSRSVRPTLALTAGVLPNVTTVDLAPGAKTVFKLENNSTYAGTITNALDGASSSFMQFAFAAGANVDTQATYWLSNVKNFTIPQVAAAWPNTNSCKTKRCYTTSCDATNAVAIGATATSAITNAQSSCMETNTGITLYYCSAQ